MIIHSGPTNIAALLVEIADLDRNTNRVQSQTEERAAEQADAETLSDMSRAADYRLASGLTTSAATIASAGCEFGAADAPSKVASDRDLAGSKLAVGLGKATSSVLDRVGADADVDAKSSEQTAARRHEAARDAKKAADDDSSLIERAIQTVHDLDQASNDAAMAVARMRA